MSIAKDLQPELTYIDFESKIHEDILDKLRKRKQAGQQARSDRVTKWDEAEKIFSAYVPEGELDAQRRNLRTNTGMPAYTTVTIPYAYATLMTAHTYFSSVFLSRAPVYQVQGVGAEGADSEQAMEALLAYQLANGNNLAPLYLWMLDHAKYGEGYMCQYWDVDANLIPVSSYEPKRFMGFPIPGTQKKVTGFQEIVNYEGARFFNIRPQDFFCDPAVTPARLQEGSFAGWVRFVSMNTITKKERMGYYYNVNHIPARHATSRQSVSQAANIPSQTSMINYGNDDIRGCELTEIIVELSPKDWKIPGCSSREHFEKWVFTVANDEVIIAAQPLGMFHNEYPIDVLEYELEAYNVAKRGMLEMLKPLNDTLEWLINTHFYNVRKSLNNEWIYDPSVLLSKDVERPGPGKLIRVRPDKYGTDVRAAFYQIQTQDVTQGNIRDAQMVIEMMQRLTGVNDAVMGVLGNNRRTATEVRTSSSFAVNRLKTMCEYMSAVGFAPHARRLMQMSQQNLERSMILRRIAPEATVNVNVTPESIAGNFNYVPVDGTLPVDRMAQAAMMNNIMTSAARIPQIGQRLDFYKIFAFTAKNLMGVRNFDSFQIQQNPLQVAPTEQTMKQVDAGNMVPVPGVDSGV